MSKKYSIIDLLIWLNAFKPSVFKNTAMLKTWKWGWQMVKMGWGLCLEIKVVSKWQHWHRHLRCKQTNPSPAKSTWSRHICFVFTSKKGLKMSQLQSLVRLGVRSVVRQMNLPKLAAPVSARSISCLVSQSARTPAILASQTSHRTLATKCKAWIRDWRVGTSYYHLTNLKSWYEYSGFWLYQV